METLYGVFFDVFLMFCSVLWCIFGVFLVFWGVFWCPFCVFLLFFVSRGKSRQKER